MKIKNLICLISVSMILAFSLTFFSCGQKNDKNSQSKTTKKEDESKLSNINAKTNNIKNSLLKMISDKKAFAPGSYSTGQIPEGEYAFLVQGSGYYSEEVNCEIIDNENFASFGYVYNHGMGNIKCDGILINIQYLGETGHSSIKSLYENITGQKNYNFSGHYKIGVDIPQGNYILQSVGTGYMEINQGPIGKSNIIDNDNFNGSKSITLLNGQYLKLNRVKIKLQ